LSWNEQDQESGQPPEGDVPAFQELEGTRLRISRLHLRLNPSKLVFLEKAAAATDDRSDAET
jgi:hypothetical protein